MIIAVINNKGGTGKTTTSVNLSAALVQKGRTVLLCDLDPQASASLSLGVTYNELRPSLADLLFHDASMGDAIRATRTEGLDLIPGSMELASSDLILADAAGRENLLAQALTECKSCYDFIIIDCAPSLSMLQINAFAASDSFIVPLMPDYLAIEGLVSLMDAVERVRSNMGIELRLMGILFTMVTAAFHPLLSKELQSQMRIIELVREHYGEKVFNTIVKRDLSLAEAPSHGKTIFEYSPLGKSAGAYTMLADEVLQRLRSD
ncbi:MAG: ParA family protein [Candidatus Xenobiia bacterium LiM19]